jgi:hypothetical protein
MAAVRKLCSEAVLLENGAVRMLGSTEEVIDEYLALQTSETLSLIQLPEGEPDNQGEATYLLTTDQSDTPKAQFRVGECWNITLYFRIHKHLEHVIAAVGLVTVDAIPLVTYWSAPKDLAPGYYSVRFECKLPLQKCDMQFAVGLSSYERSFYHIPTIGHVCINEIAVGEQSLRGAECGLLVANQISEIRPASPEAINVLRQAVPNDERLDAGSMLFS